MLMMYSHANINNIEEYIGNMNDDLKSVNNWAILNQIKLNESNHRPSSYIKENLIPGIFQ